MIAVNGRPYAVHTLRLVPGEDVRISLQQWAETNGVEAAAIVSAAGSVSEAMLRYGGQEGGTLLRGDLEVCALSGTLARHGLHVHMAVADSEGRMAGGHLLAGTLVRTTMEIVIQEIGGVRFLRALDRATGSPELMPEPIKP